MLNTFYDNIFRPFFDFSENSWGPWDVKLINGNQNLICYMQLIMARDPDTDTLFITPLPNEYWREGFTTMIEAMIDRCLVNHYSFAFPAEGLEISDERNLVVMPYDKTFEALCIKTARMRTYSFDHLFKDYKPAKVIPNTINLLEVI